MNQNQIDRLYKVAISKNAYTNKMGYVEEVLSPSPDFEYPKDYSTQSESDKVLSNLDAKDYFQNIQSNDGTNSQDVVRQYINDIGPFDTPLPLSEMDPRNPKRTFPARNGPAPLSEMDPRNPKRTFPARNGPAPVASTTGFNFETFKKILQNPNVQMGAGLGAAGLAGYGIYKHLNKKKKRHEDED